MKLKKLDKNILQMRKEKLICMSLMKKLFLKKIYIIRTQNQIGDQKLKPKLSIKSFLKQNHSKKKY